jgi:hypothetical protein
MTAFVTLLALLLPYAPQQQDRPKRPLAAEALVDRARGLAPEFAADLLLRLASSPAIPDRPWKLELIEEAFRTAAAAQLQAPRTGGPHTDSRFGPHALASDTRLNRLSLQVQAVEAMLFLHPGRALELFRQIPLPELKPVPCTEIVVEHTGAFYEVVPKLFAAAFSGEQRRRGDDIAFVSAVIRGMRADPQVEPVSKMIERIEASPEARQQWLNDFAAALKTVQGTDRTFTAGMWIGLTALAKFSGSHGLARAAYLGAAREFVISKITGAYCDDAAGKTKVEPWVEALNAAIQAEIERGNGDLRPIVLRDLKRGSASGTFKNVDWWQSSRSKEVLEALRWLNHGNRDLPGDKRFWTAEERATQQWNDRYIELLKLLEDWKPGDGETREDTYHMKAITYDLLARLVPPGPARLNAIRNLLAFLDASYHDIPNRAEWFVHVRDLLTRGDSEIRNEARRARNPVITMYAEVDTPPLGAIN